MNTILNTRLLKGLIIVIILVVAVLGNASLGQRQAFAAGTGPCDIYASGGTPCVAAHSTVRALYGSYNGNLYQVRRASDSATLNIGVLEAGGFANAAAQDSFCAGTSCVITIIYDQSGHGNNLTQAPPGGFSGPAAGGYDNLANASQLPLIVGGHNVYGVYVAPGTGYRNNNTSGIATGDQAEGMYAIFDGTHYNNGCCFDYGNAETSSLDTGNGHMEAIYFGNITAWGRGAGNGPWIMADLENGLFSGINTGLNSGDPSITYHYVTAIIKGGPNLWAIRGGNAQSGSLSTYYSGARPNASGYNPMHKEGAIILGIGGDNSNSSAGSFFEGAMTSGYPSDTTENAVQANIVAAGYGSGSSGATLTPTNTQAPSQNPVHQYTFDGNANDSGSGSTANGTVSGGSYVSGQIGQAISLNGSSNYVSFPTGFINNLGDFSIATWVYLNSSSSWNRVFDFGTGTDVNMFLTPQNGSTNAVRFAITTSGNGSEQQITGSSALPTGVWTHVTVTKSGNTGRLYVNGTLVGTNSSMTLSPASLGNTTQNWIGRSQYSADPYLNGRVDDFRIYNRALSASEVSTLASGGGGNPTPTFTPPPGPSPTPTNTPISSQQNPIALYPFDGNANDTSGNGYNATLNGGSYVSGQIGQAVSLNGSSNYVSLPTGIVSSLSDFSIASWVYLNSSSSWNRVFDFGTGTSVYMFLSPQNGSTSAVRFAITTGGNGSEQQITGSSALPTGTWVHVAVTKSGNTGTLYVNGSVVGTNNSMTLSPSSLGNTTQNWIGRSQWSADPYLNGLVDDFRIYSRALSASEVSSLASGGGSNPTATPTSTPSSSSTTYQAENASLGGGVSVDTNHTGYNGTGFVNFPATGGYVEYQNVDGGSGGSRTLVFRFALGASSSRTGQLTVNGVTQNITFQPTGSWNTWNTMNVTVNLNSGTTNTIRLQSTGQDLANQDQMTVN